MQNAKVAAIPDDEIARINDRGRDLVDQLLAVVDLGDRQCAYLSAMQLLLSRSGLDPQEVLDALTSLVAHNLCAGAAIRLVVVRADGETPPPEAVH